MSAITTHVLDTARGRPAEGVPVVLEHQTDEGGWRALGRGKTDADGRLRDLLSQEQRLSPGVYRLTFDTAPYFNSQGAAGFYPEVSVTFFVADASQHYHVPLLLSPFGYSTYRGS
jgi:5-hydroxyisourate hydrolase